MRVTVVLNPDFDDDPTTLGDAYWLIESPANRRLAEHLRTQGGFDPNSAVFKGKGEYAADDFARLFDVVALHHPGWRSIEFVGVSLRRDLAGALETAGTCRPTDRGFALERPAAAEI